MNVLIVDDQPNAVSSLKCGVHWDKLDIHNVYTALNAADAKKIIQSHPVDILLSDIEMPSESGLSLFRWCRNNNYHCECIFLTSHADFFYAQEAIQLGSFDYILLPARYEDIENAIQNTIQKILEKQEKKVFVNYGKVACSQKNTFLKGILDDWLNGKYYQIDPILTDLREINIPLNADSIVYLAQFQLLSWVSLPRSFDEWSADTESVFSEIFDKNRYHTISYCPDKTTMFVLIYSDESAMMSLEVYQSKLNLAYSQLTRRLSCNCAIYTASSVAFDQIPACADEILQRKRENLLLTPGIYMNPSVNDQPVTHCDIQMLKRFEFYMVNHQALRAEQDAILFLFELNEKNLLNHDTLIAFCKDYQQAAYSAAMQLNLFAHSLPVFEEYLVENDNSFLTLQSASDYLKQLTLFFNTEKPDMDTSHSNLSKIEQYIQDNLDKPLLCSDIAKAVYLSPDYITRLFQKEKGISLKEYITQEKMNAARDLILTTSLPISLIAAKVGYDNFSHFSKVYRKIMNITPSAERKK